MLYVDGYKIRQVENFGNPHAFRGSSEMNKLLTVEEAVAFLQVSKPTMYRLTSQKKIPFYKIGGSVRFSEAHLIAWLDRHGVVPMEGFENDREAI